MTPITVVEPERHGMKIRSSKPDTPNSAEPSNPEPEILKETVQNPMLFDNGAGKKKGR